MHIILNLLFFFLFLLSCNQAPSNDPNTTDTTSILSKKELIQKKHLLNPNGKNLEKRVQTPNNFTRKEIVSPSFANYLRTLPLKPAESEVRYFDGTIKTNQEVYDAVIDLPIGKKDLHQCADAIMRLKAEYHWQQKEYDQIHFNFTNGFKVAYSEWRKGKKVIIEGNKTYWNNESKAATTYKDFWEYLELVFTYAGTSSLSKELKDMEIMQMNIGDIFIQGGFPGHAVIVLDMAKQEATGELLYLLGQSYMPAQEIQVLKNNQDQSISPWYRLHPTNRIFTPEWTFEATDLKRF